MTQTTSIVLIILTAIGALATLLLALYDKNIGKRYEVPYNHLKKLTEGDKKHER
jgi:hypothetical protein